MPQEENIKSILKTSLRLPFHVSNWISGGKEKVSIEQYYSEEQKSVIWKFIPGSGVMGPPGFCHGGFLASVMDESMGSCAFWNGHIVMAIHLQIKYRASSPLNKVYFVISRLTRLETRRIYTGSTIIDMNNKIFASSTGVYVKVPWEKMKDPPIEFEKFKILKELLNEGLSVSEILRKISEE